MDIKIKGVTKAILKIIPKPKETLSLLVPFETREDAIDAVPQIIKAQLNDRIEMVEKIAKEADDYLWQYILKAVTENLSYTHLKTRFDIPCGKDMYYDRYRKFFWLLNKARG